MKHLFILSLLSVLSHFGYSQTITILDQSTGEPLEMVSLSGDEQGVTASTDINGQTDITAFKKMENITVSRTGFTRLIISYAEIEKQGFVLGLAPAGLTMEELIVSATRWSQSSRDIPAKITTITAREVALMNPQTAADLLGASGKVFIQKSQQGGGSPMIRGFSTNRLLYVVDGVRMNTAIFRSGNLQNVISLDPFAIQHTEVFFGPGSVIYGSDAIGGVMSFQTLTPLLSASDGQQVKGKAVTRYSSANNEKTGHFDINLGWKKWASVTSISSNNFGDLRMGSKGPEEYLRPFYVQRIDSVDVVVTNEDPRVQRPSGYSQINMMQKLRFRPNDQWDFQYGFHFSETSDYARYDRHIRYKNGLPRYGEWNYGPQKWMMNLLSVAHNGNNALYDQMTLRLAQQFFEESRFDRDINKNERHIRIEKVDAWSGNLDFSKSVGTRSKLQYGLEAALNDVTSLGIDEDIATGTEAPGPARYPQATWSSYAAYLNYQWRMSEKLLLQTGVRYNYYKLDAVFDNTFYPFPFTDAKLSKGSVSGSLGMTFRPTEKWAFNANVSTGFRSPNVDDIGKVFDSEPGAVTVPNPALAAEYAYNAEIGIAKLFGEIVKIDLTGYYTILRNAMVRRDFTLNGLDSIVYDGALSQVQAIQNAAVATVYGIQAGLTIKLPSGFGFSSDFNYQKGSEELDDGTISPSRHAPPAYGISRLSYSRNKLDVQFYAVYSGARKFEDLPQEEQGKTEIYAVDEEGNPWSPGWATLNFKAMYQFSKNFTIGAGLENITDQRYRPYSSGIVAPGRDFVLSLKAEF
jgi:hemoglobin/transferrin/lactoferrin receptor protein